MFRLKLVHNLRTVLWLFLVALIPVSAVGLYWANETGLPDEWRQAIELEISKHGVHVELGSLTYIPLEGFVARNVRVFAEKTRDHEISRLERVQLVLDYTSLAGGEFRVRKVELRNAQLSLPVDPKKPDGESLRFKGIYGTIFMPNERLIEVRDAKAKVGGVDVTLSARLLGKNPSKHGPDEERNEGRRREMIANILNEMQHWNFGTEAPPSIQVEVEGELSDKNTFKATFQIEAPYIEKQQYQLTGFTALGTLSGQLLTFSSFTAKDPRGAIEGSADYQIFSRDGHFDMKSSIDIPRLVTSWLATPVKIDLLNGGSQKFEFAGEFNLKDLSKPIVNLTGHALLESIMFRGIPFDSLETWFSWQDGDLFLRDLRLKRPDGMAEGKILKEKNIVRIQLHSTLPVRLYSPLFTGKPLEKVINDFSETSESSNEIFLDGSLDTEDRFAWAYTGHGTLNKMSYRGVPFETANCSFIVNSKELDFYDGSLTFDYSDYKLRKTYDGPASGTATIGRIRYDGESKTVAVESVAGDIWASPMIRLFAPEIADNIEKYRFHTPPALTGSGIVDVTPQRRTDLTVKFKTTGLADYEFLGENITLSEPVATVKIVGNEVRVSKLSAEVFGGPVTGKFTQGENSKLSGELSWSKLSMSALSSTYDFELKGGGQVTGRIEFSITDGDVSTMSGKGLVALENATLFSVPIFGPLSTVISKVLDDEKVGFQTAQFAFCNFRIEEGMLSTKDFQSATNSVVFAGDGAVNLTKLDVDFTIRLNARGLLGLLTLPFRPFYGLFQFRGTGPLKDTTWENVHFTSPPEDLNEILLSPPPKALIIEE